MKSLLTCWVRTSSTVHAVHPLFILLSKPVCFPLRHVKLSGAGKGAVKTEETWHLTSLVACWSWDNCMRHVCPFRPKIPLYVLPIKQYLFSGYHRNNLAPSLHRIQPKMLFKQIQRSKCYDWPHSWVNQMTLRIKCLIYSRKRNKFPKEPWFISFIHTNLM